MSLFSYALLCVHSSFAIILKRKRKLVALLLLSYRCIVTINVLWLFLTVPGCSISRSYSLPFLLLNINILKTAKKPVQCEMKSMILLDFQNVLEAN